jgi:hypothetical protein
MLQTTDYFEMNVNSLKYKWSDMYNSVQETFFGASLKENLLGLTQPLLFAILEYRLVPTSEKYEWQERTQQYPAHLYFKSPKLYNVMNKMKPVSNVI